MSPDDSFADMEMQKQGGMLASGLLTIRGQRKNSRTRRTLGSALDSRSGRPNGKLLNGNVGTPWRDGRTEIGGPSLMTVELGADFRIAHCAPISLGPTR